MDMPKFLDLAVKLETEISKLYRTIAERSGDAPIAARLYALANEEVNHANVLRRGRQYYDELPEFFPGFTMDTDDAEKGLEEIKEYQASLGKGKIPLLERIRKILEFEKRLERIHLTTSMAIREPSLRKLFVDLMGGDHSHVLVLQGLIESFGDKVKEVRKRLE
jgi:rubrerythrin